LNPNPSGEDQFAVRVLGMGENAVIGAPKFGTFPLIRGAAYVYDDAGKLVKRIDNPTSAINSDFGFGLASVGNSLLVSAHLATANGASMSGVVHLFEGIDPPELVGDTDLDGDVDAEDFVTVKANFANARLGRRNGDVDGDGEVTLRDFSSLKSNFGAWKGDISAGTAIVPEPTSGTLAVLALLGALLVVKRRRVR
jgi:hypothetical protein